MEHNTDMPNKIKSTYYATKVYIHVEAHTGIQLRLISNFELNLQ